MWYMMYTYIHIYVYIEKNIYLDLEELASQELEVWSSKKGVF